MKTHRLVLTEDLNQFGFLFGGRLLSWVDEASWIAATLDFPNCQFVTVGMDRVSFKHSVKKGEIIEICCTQQTVGNTSVCYKVEVFRGKESDGESIFSTLVSFVNVDAEGVKTSIVKN